MTHRTRANRCIRCDELLDAATQVTAEGDGPARPERGDVSVCVHCNHVAVFTRGGKLREPRPDELRAFMADERVIKTRDALSLLHVDKTKPN
jgi:hypothetical protein